MPPGLPGALIWKRVVDEGLAWLVQAGSDEGHVAERTPRPSVRLPTP